MNNNSKAVVFGAVAVAIVVAATIDVVKVTKTERAKRREIKENLNRDLTAIRLASDRIKTRIDRGDYDGHLYDVAEDLNYEIRFEQIRIREF
jgi:hypothetical protein